ncbi:MAG: ABC transporter permease [Nitrospinota bacterium]
MKGEGFLEALQEARQDPRAFLRARRRYALFPVSFVVFVGSWEGFVRLLGVPSFLLPAPSAVGVALLRGLFLVGLDTSVGADFFGAMQNSYYLHIAHTFLEAILGFLIGGFIGFGLGLLFLQSEVVEEIILPYVVAFQTLPKLAIAPLFVIWFGYEIHSKVLLAGLVAFFPLLVNTMVGLKSAQTDQIDLLRSLSASRWQTFWKLQFPNAMPFIFAGLELAVVFSLLGALLGEFVGAGQCLWGGRGQCGLGVLLMQMSFSSDTTGTFAVLIILAVMGVIMHKAVKLLRRKVLFWAPETGRNLGT